MVSIDRHVVFSLQKYNSQHSQTKIPSESIKAGKHILQCKLIWRYSFSYLADEHTHTIQYICPMRVGHIASKHPDVLHTDNEPNPCPVYIRSFVYSYHLWVRATYKSCPLSRATTVVMTVGRVVRCGAPSCYVSHTDNSVSPLCNHRLSRCNGPRFG